jgi:hypothetical protein
MKTEVTLKELRSFGLIVGGIFTLVGMWPLLIRGNPFRLWAIAFAGLAIVIALVVPRGLKPIYRVWMFIGHVLGWINTRIILTVGFYGIVMPVGLMMRAFGKDPMRRKSIGKAETYRIARTSRTGMHMKQQF